MKLALLLFCILLTVVLVECSRERGRHGRGKGGGKGKGSRERSSSSSSSSSSESGSRERRTTTRRPTTTRRNPSTRPTLTTRRMTPPSGSTPRTTPRTTPPSTTRASTTQATTRQSTTTRAPTTPAPTTQAPTTQTTTTQAPTTQTTTTQAPTTQTTTTQAPTTQTTTTQAPTTQAPTTPAPTTQAPTTVPPATTAATGVPTTVGGGTSAPTTPSPSCCIYLNVKGNPISSGSVLLDANGRNQDVTVAYRCGSNFYDATWNFTISPTILGNRTYCPATFTTTRPNQQSNWTLPINSGGLATISGCATNKPCFSLNFRIIGSNPTMQDVKNYLNSTEILGELSRKGASVPWYALYILLAESANPQQFDASGSPFYKTNITGYLLNSPGIGLYQISTERFGINLTCQHVWSWKQNTKAAVNVMLSHELLALNEAYFGRCNSQKMCGGSPPPKTVQIPTTSEGCNANRTSCGCTFVDTNFQRPNANNGSRNQFPIEDAFAMKLYHDKTVPYYRWINGTAAYPNGAWNYTPCNLITSVNLVDQVCGLLLRGERGISHTEFNCKRASSGLITGTCQRDPGGQRCCHNNRDPCDSMNPN